MQIADYSRHIHKWHINPDNESPLRELALSHKHIRDTGNMIPDKEVEKLILCYLYARERILANELQFIEVKPGENPPPMGIERFICSGWPRNQAQIEAMHVHFRNPMIVLLDVSFKESNEKRLKRIEECEAAGETRTDDLDEGTFMNRWHIYQHVTEPAIKSFGGRVVRIDSTLRLEKKVRRFVQECIPHEQIHVRKSMFSKFLPHPSNPERGRPVTKATQFIDHIEFGAPLHP
jgi:adenylate kinase family enzyme